MLSLKKPFLSPNIPFLRLAQIKSAQNPVFWLRTSEKGHCGGRRGLIVACRG